MVSGRVCKHRCKSRLYDITYVKHIMEVSIGHITQSDVCGGVGGYSFLNKARPQLSLKSQ